MMALFGLFLTMSAALVLGVGMAEAYRTYPLIQLDRLNAQGAVVARSLQPYIHAGVPLDQVSGFEPLTRPLMSSSRDLKSVEVFDASEKAVLATRKRNPIEARREDGAWVHRSDELGDTFDAVYEVSLPLSSRFETVGQLKLVMSQAFVRQKIAGTFLRVAEASGGLLVFCLGAVALALRLRPKKSRWILSLGFSLGVMAVSGVLITEMVQLYSQGIVAKTAALAASLGQRLQAPMDLGLELTDFDGLDTTFRGYRELNPEISGISLVRGETVLIHTNAAKVGTVAEHDDAAFEQSWDLENPWQDGSEALTLTIAVPKRMVYASLWGACKNLLALFIALILVSRLLLGLLMVSTAGAQEGQPTTAAEIQKIQVVHTVTVLMEGLCLPVMATWLAEVLGRQGMGPGAVSWIFTAFFAGYAFILIPAGHIARRWGAKTTLLIGVGCAVVGWVGLSLASDYYSLMLLRALAGAGQGLSLIGVQTALLNLSDPEQKTKNLSLMVLGYQTGMISGTVFGSLLALYVSVEMVFDVAALLGLLNLWLGKRSLRVTSSSSQSADPVSADPAPTDSVVGGQPARRKASWQDMLKDRGLISTALLIGIPTKAVISGLVFFGLPLTLSRLEFSADEIGQILMLYSVGVLLSNLSAGRVVTILGGTRRALLVGMGLAACSLLVLAAGSSGSTVAGSPPMLRALLWVCGAWGLGVGHGWIHAPALSHVAGSPSAHRLGVAEVSSVFRFLERVGSMAGPILAGLWVGLGGMLFGVSALLVLMLAAIFAVLSRAQVGAVEAGP